MKVLVVGNGGREHTLVWKIAQSPKVDKIYCLPGNGGTGELAENINIKVTDYDGILNFALKEKIDLVVVGPEVPLCGGLVDILEDAGIKAFGPRANAAVIEGSKAFSKGFMEKYNIPTARYVTCKNVDDAYEALKTFDPPFVIKADGLAAGKGVLIIESYQKGRDVIKGLMDEGILGEAGAKVVIEEFLVGEEVSLLAFTDGDNVIPMVSAQDHKTIYDGDKGPNTGGMGTYSPAPVYTSQIHETVMEKIMIPTVKGMKKEGRLFKGVLYGGLIITAEGPKTLEFNARFGDPETQVILPRLKTDLVDIMMACIDGTLGNIDIEWEDNAAVCVVAASKGYPESYKTGYPIEIKEIPDDIYLFHAGTELKDNKLITSGGRVMGITAVAPTLKEAIDKAYQNITRVNFEGMYYRKDIGKKALKEG